MKDIGLNEGADHVPISVVIPCFRCADTISRAIASVHAQTFLPEEVLLVDDFSNDDGKTLKALSQVRLLYKNINIKIICLNENNGPGAARNVAWENASQPYLAFLDADDSWHPQKLELHYQWMLEHPNVVLSGHTSTRFCKALNNVDLSQQIISSHRVSGNELLFSNCFPTRTVIIKRDIPYRFISGKYYAEDYLLWLTIVLNNESAWFLNIPMAYAYKGEFGDGGLTGDLWKSQQGTLDAFKRLYSSGLITFMKLCLACSFSFVKYGRRWVIAKWQLANQ